MVSDFANSVNIGPGASSEVLSSICSLRGTNPLHRKRNWTQLPILDACALLLSCCAAFSIRPGFWL